MAPTVTDVLPYDRTILVDVLVHHWQISTSGCSCGGAELRRSHPEHVAEVYEAAVRALDPDRPEPEDDAAVLRGIVARFKAGWRPSRYGAQWYRTSRTKRPTETEPMTLSEAREMGKA